MALPSFTITASKVRAHYFPQVSDFSTSSKPTSTTVAEMLVDEAADLVAKLLEEGIVAAIIDAGATTYPAAFAWCAKTLRLAVAIRVLEAMATQNPEVMKKWKAELEERYEGLQEKGYLALGDAPIPATAANGLRSHIRDHGLDTGDTGDISDVIPTFRRTDEL